MAKGKPFILPVSVDATTERGAHVPDALLAVQWMRLPAGDGSDAFCARVKALEGWDEPRTTPFRPAKETHPHSVTKKSLRAAWFVPAFVGLVALIALAVWQPWPKPTSLPGAAVAGAAPSIAVLPFANVSEDKDANAFFADGMHEELLSALAKIGALKVISRTSVLAYRDSAIPRNLKQIAAELGVANILEGSVSRSGKSVRIIVQLIDAATDQHRWSDIFLVRGHKYNARVVAP